MTSLAHPKPPRTLPAERRRIAALGRSDAARDRKTADDLCSGLVKGRASYSCEARGFAGVRCSRGPLDWAHGIGRKRGSRAVRWAHSNGFALCRAHHEVFGHDEAAFDAWRLAKLGPVVFNEVADRAREIHRVDVKAVIWGLRRGVFIQGER